MKLLHILAQLILELHGSSLCGFGEDRLSILDIDRVINKRLEMVYTGMKNVKPSVLIFTCIFFSCLFGTQVWAEQKMLIGETAWIRIGGGAYPYLARIDTGALVTSINAIEVSITDGSKEPEKNIGKKISFITINRDGRSQQFTGIIKRISTVRNSQGIEWRYIIELALSWKNVTKTVEVNLRDRSRMSYKLLIGRNWLSDDFLVDVDMKASKTEQGDADGIAH